MKLGEKSRNDLVKLKLDLDTLRNNFIDLNDIYCKKELDIFNPRYIVTYYDLHFDEDKNNIDKCEYFNRLDLKLRRDGDPTKEYNNISSKTTL